MITFDEWFNTKCGGDYLNKKEEPTQEEIHNIEDWEDPEMVSKFNAWFSDNLYAVTDAYGHVDARGLRKAWILAYNIGYQKGREQK